MNKDIISASINDLLLNYVQSYIKWLEHPDSELALGDNQFMVAIQNEFKRRGAELVRLQKENEDLRLQLQAARDHQDVLPHWTVGVDWARPECDKTLTLDQAEAEFRRQPMRVVLDSEALEPDAPDGQIKYWFNIASGPYRAPDTLQERGFSWARGPFVSWAAADEGWKDYIKRQRENGQP